MKPSVARSFAVDQTGDLARGRYTRLIDELNELMTQVDTVSLEIDTYRRGEISAEMEEQQMWPFDGEYWRDELGFYRQQVTSQCGR